MSKQKLTIVLCLMCVVTLLLSTVTVHAAGEKLNYKSTTFCKYNTKTLKVYNTSKKATWNSSNTSVATVSSKGVVSGKKAGTATITAKVNGKSLKCKVTITDHSYYVSSSKKATCTNSGYKLYTCKKCGYDYKETVKATGHSYGSWVVDKKATPIEKGSKHKTCSKCKVVKRETISKNKLNSPIKNMTKSTAKITSDFGYITPPVIGKTFHNGIDLAYPKGTKIYASEAGTVITATSNSSAGKHIVINHGNGLYTYYYHCDFLNVKKGDKVKRDQYIGKVGATGAVTGVHLHFGVKLNGDYVNPTLCLWD